MKRVRYVIKSLTWSQAFGTAPVMLVMYWCLFSAITFIAWWIIIGISTEDNRVLYWLLTNGIIIIILQPWFMRFSRVVYLNFFVKYNENYDKEEGKTFDY